ncbi:MAG: hypothetical protein J6P93_04925 [Alphaproteobacteria bacterium]|nr:hypothetical protein [Alphaproteobacteria bacterium]
MDSFLLALDNPELWKGVAFFMAMTIICMPIYSVLLGIVVKRSKQISERMSKALDLRSESEKMLKEIQHKSFYRESQRKKILQNALKDARILKEDANKELEERLANRKEEIMDRVRLIKRSGLRELKEKVVSIAVDTTEEILHNSEEESEKDAFMDAGIQELKQILKQEDQKQQLLNVILDS